MPVAGAECQLARGRKQQAAWRRRNPDYFAARRILARKSVGLVEPLRVPPPLNRLPWDIAQSEFGVQGADFIGLLATLLLCAAQTQFPMRVADSIGDGGRLRQTVDQTQIGSGAGWSGQGSGPDAAGMAPT